MNCTEEKLSFTFEELDDHAKDTARAILAPDYNWWDFTYEQAIEDGRDKGFTIRNDDLQFSGFASQGDGCSWKGTIDVQVWLLANYPEPRADARIDVLLALVNEGVMASTRTVTIYNTNYCHSGGMRIVSMWEACSGVDDVLLYGIFAGASVQTLLDSIDFEGSYAEAMDEEMVQSARAYANEIYNNLEEEYDWLRSDESITETCATNGYLFDENGGLL